MKIGWLLALVACLSLALTGLLRHFAAARGLIDIPNARSSHSRPMPRGGGLAIVVTFFGAVLTLALQGAVDWRLWWALLGASVVAAIGFLDDHDPVPVRWRLAVQVAAALWALGWLGGLPPLVAAGATVDLGWLGHVLAAVYLVWLLNLYNFMDGIDGIAGVEAVAVGLSAALLSLWVPAAAGEALVPASLAMAALGFLYWNFPPARIFMGDVGSGFIGLVFGILSLHAATIAPHLLWAWLILLGVFVVDATWALIRRLLAGEKIFQAHRSHGYQVAARRWGHRRVTVAVAVIDGCWLLPLAALVALDRLEGVIAVVIAYAPLLILMTWLRSSELNRGES
ncbi:MAG: MraY family glycosyltransferase [Porticoccaceae bacterium]